MRRTGYARLRELLFRVGVWAKALDALLELAGGVALQALKPGRIVRIVHLLTQDEIAEDPRDLVANWLRHAVSRFAYTSKHFMVIYLLAHGVVKLLVVVALLRGKLWAYPVSLAVFGGFVVYQIYRYSASGGVPLLGLTALDLVVMVLIWLEYRAMRSSRHVRSRGEATSV